MPALKILSFADSSASKKKDNLDDSPSDPGSNYSPICRKSQPPPTAFLQPIVGVLDKVNVSHSPPGDPSNEEKISEECNESREAIEQSYEEFVKSKNENVSKSLFFGDEFK